MAKDLISEFVGAISTDTPEPNTTYNAIVSRVDADGTVWVSVEGSNNETPTASVSSEAKKGDAVKVEWRNNKLYLAGNYTDPAAGVETVKAVAVKAGQAMDLADSAKADVKSVNQYFWHVKNGAERGAHITEVPQAVFSADPENGGGNLLATSSGIAVRDGLTELATFGAEGAQIGLDSEGHVVTTSNGITMHVGSEELLNIFSEEISQGHSFSIIEKEIDAVNRIFISFDTTNTAKYASFLAVHAGSAAGIELIASAGGRKEINMSGNVEVSGSLRDTIISATPTITRTSGGTISNIVYRRTGNVAMLSFAVAYNTSVASGANVFVGTLEDGYRPVAVARGVGYYGAHSIIGQIGSDGETITNQYVYVYAYWYN